MWKARFLIVLLSFAAFFASAETERCLVGAHFYAWYSPSSWDRINGEPVLGRYSSSDPSVIDRQIRWASEFGIDFFGIEWSGPQRTGDRVLSENFLASPELNNFRFCIAYDTLSRFGGLRPPYNFDDPEIFNKFINDFDYISKRYFGHPRYLKFDGRPVVWLYLGRSMQGDWKEALKKVRQRVKRNGYELYLDGDLLAVHNTDTSRLKYFDAASAYILNQKKLFREWDIRHTVDVLPLARSRFEDWSKTVPHARNSLTGLPVAFHPVITPQFDKPSDPDALKYTLRSPDDFRRLAEVARATASRDTLADAKVIWITSWNEWYEGTSVEPTLNGPRPDKNYGFQLLEVIRDVFGGTVADRLAESE